MFCEWKYYYSLYILFLNIENWMNSWVIAQDKQRWKMRYNNIGIMCELSLSLTKNHLLCYFCLLLLTPNSFWNLKTNQIFAVGLHESYNFKLAVKSSNGTIMVFTHGWDHNTWLCLKNQFHYFYHLVVTNVLYICKNMFTTFRTLLIETRFFSCKISLIAVLWWTFFTNGSAYSPV